MAIFFAFPGIAYAATFTVDSTADTADATLNGLCADSGGNCTLRAAIAESNFIAGDDNIYFNISTSDTAYVDYNSLLPSSGDSTDGDDFWLIQPASEYPAITGGTVIDAATQTTNQSNSNTSGPEIEISGQLIGASKKALNFSTGANNSRVNSFMIDRFASGYGVFTGSVDNFEVTNCYFGLDATGLLGFSDSLRFNAAIQTGSGNGVRIGNTKSDGNFITGTTNYSILAYDTKNLTVRGNVFNLDKNANNWVSTTAGPYLNGTVTGEIGGASANQGNIINSNIARSVIFYPSTSDLVDVGIYNNIMGASATGAARYAGSSPIYIEGGSTTSGTQIPIKIGGLGKGNYIANGDNPGIYLNNARNYDIGYNYIGALHYGIYMPSTGSTADFNVHIYNNVIGNNTGTIDPYFGFPTGIIQIYGIYCNESNALIENNNVNTVKQATFIAMYVPTKARIYNNTIKNSSLGILGSHYTEIKGNIISDNLYYGIYLIPPKANRLSVYSSTAFKAVGGSLNFAGSLCNGKEQNCMSGNSIGGIYNLDQPITNEATLYTDNSFGAGNGPGGNNNVEQAWTGMFEVFSGTARRTDLINGSNKLNLPTANKFQAHSSTYYISSLQSQITNYNRTCLIAGDCPVAGSSSGVNGVTSTFGPGTSFTDPNNWLRVVEYYIDKNGVRHNYPKIKLDENHFASTLFSFDGNSTTDPVTADIGEPWTSDPAATRNVETSVFGEFQIMQAQFVDANPVKQQDGSYIITIDTNTVEDNVSIAGYDDGDGAYSGGGIQGPDGLANGLTSLPEAQFVAANFTGGTVDIKYKISLTSPISSKDIPISSVDFSWQASADPLISKYEIYVGDSTTTLAKIGETSGTTFTGIVPGDFSLTDLKDYYWKVIGRRADNSLSGESDIENFQRAHSVVGLNALVPDLNINKSGTNEVFPLYYPLKTFSGFGGNVNNLANVSNGCLPNDVGIADVGPLDTYAGGAAKLHNYKFTFSPDVTVKSFKFVMVDFGDFMPFSGNADHTYWFEAIAYDPNNNIVTQQKYSYFTLSNGSNRLPNGDACPNSEHTFGYITFTLTGENIVRVEAHYRDLPSTDPNVALSIPEFAIETYPVPLVYPIGGIVIDDATPQLDWNPSAIGERLNPGAAYYKVFVDGVQVAQVDGSLTKYQLLNRLSLNETHTWQVIAYRSNGVESGRSIEETFSVAVPDYDLEPIYPVDVSIDDKTPLFDWSDIPSGSLATYYELYVDGQLIKTDIPVSDSGYQLPDELALSIGAHVWYVIAYYDDTNGNKFEVGRTRDANFEVIEVLAPPVITQIPIPTSLPQTGKGSGNIITFTTPELIALAPLLLISTTQTSLITYSFFATGILITLRRIGVIIGIFIPKKRKYWGIVWDEVEYKGIPFAVVTLMQGKTIVKTTVTDLDGKYGILLDDAGEYYMQVSASGFKPHFEKIVIDNIRAEVIKDVKMSRTDGKVSLFNRLRFYAKEQIFRVLNLLWSLLVVLGFFFSIYAAYLNPVLINYIIIVLYILLFIFNVFIFIKLKKRYIGSVKELLTGTPLPGAVVRFYSLGNQIDLGLTDKFGGLKMRMKNGEYDIKAHKLNYVQAQENLRIKVTEEGYLNTNIEMKKLESDVTGVPKFGQ